jgi:hypothetical protein
LTGELYLPGDDHQMLPAQTVSVSRRILRDRHHYIKIERNELVPGAHRRLAPLPVMFLGPIQECPAVIPVIAITVEP